MKFHTPQPKPLHPDYKPCQQCGCIPFTPYMIKNDLWKEVATGDSLLCLKCFTIRLGRTLRLEDFRPCQLTNLIMLGFAIGTGQDIDMSEGYESER